MDKAQKIVIAVAISTLDSEAIKSIDYNIQKLDRSIAFLSSRGGSPDIIKQEKDLKTEYEEFRKMAEDENTKAENLKQKLISLGKKSHEMYSVLQNWLESTYNQYSWGYSDARKEAVFIMEDECQLQDWVMERLNNERVSKIRNRQYDYDGAIKATCDAIEQGLRHGRPYQNKLSLKQFGVPFTWNIDLQVWKTFEDYDQLEVRMSYSPNYSPRNVAGQVDFPQNKRYTRQEIEEKAKELFARLEKDADLPLTEPYDEV